MGVDTIQINLVKPVVAVKLKAGVSNGQIKITECFGWFCLGQFFDLIMVYCYLSYLKSDFDAAKLNKKIID